MDLREETYEVVKPKETFSNSRPTLKTTSYTEKFSTTTMLSLKSKSGMRKKLASPEVVFCDRKKLLAS